ncbi:hypothetical protein ACOTGI_06395 [Achromobacter xylosoxidans]
MISVEEFIKPLGSSFTAKSAPQQVVIFGWYLHAVREQANFGTGDIGACFDAAHVARPANIAATLAKLVGRKDVLRSGNSFRLSANVRSATERMLPVRASTVSTTKLLNDLVPRGANSAQQTFLNETLRCFKQGAFRAAIVMAWNLAYSHVCDRILASQIVPFNAQKKLTYPKLPDITKMSDFEDYRESQVIEICRGARILDATVCKHLTAQLNRRNSAAHPSSATFMAAQAEDTITDLVNNVLLNPAV